MGSTIVAKVQEDNTPIVVLQQYEFGDSKGVLSVRIKNDKKGPQTGDVVLDLDDAVISLLDYDPTYEYKENNICIFNGMLFKAKQIPTFGEFKPEEWEELDKVDILAENYKPNFVYEKNQVCVVNHMFYRAKKDFTSPDIFDISQWEEIGGATIDDYQMSIHINRWQPIIFNNAIYRAKDDLTTSTAGNIIEAWELDKDKFEEVKSGDSVYLTKTQELTYNKDTKTFTSKKIQYQLNSSKEEIFIDEFVHDETINVETENIVSGIKAKFSIPIAKYDKLGLIKSAKIMNDPHYRGEMASQGSMDSIQNPKYGDFCDRLDTNTEWFYNGTLWVNTGTPIGTSPHEKILENYVQVDDEGFGFVSMSSDSLLRLATDEEAAGRVSTHYAINPNQLALYGGNLRQLETVENLPVKGKSYDLYYVKSEKRFYVWKNDSYELLGNRAIEYVPHLQYDKYEIVVYNNKLYRAKETFRDSGTFNLSKWEEIGGEGFGDWKKDTTYKSKSFVYYNGAIYRAKDDILASTTFDYTKWEKITYSENDKISQKNNIFYINEASGEDAPENGSSIKPFKTFFYAIAQIHKKIKTVKDGIVVVLDSNLTINNKSDFPEIENTFLNGLSNIEFRGADIDIEIPIGNINNSNNIFFRRVAFGRNSLKSVSASKNITFKDCLFSNIAKDSTTENFDIDKSTCQFIKCEFEQNSKLFNLKNGSEVFVRDLKLNEINTINNEAGLVIFANKVKYSGPPTSNPLVTNYENTLGYYNESPIRDFNSNTFYQRHQQISFNGLQYRAKDNFYSSTEFDPDNWELIEPIVEDYKKEKFYAKGLIVKFGNALFRAKENISNSPEQFDSSKWEKLADSTAVESFKEFWNYKTGELVFYNGAIYVVKENFVSTNLFNPDNFNLVSSSSGSGINDFKPNNKYIKNDVIYYFDKLYRANVDFTSTDDFNSADWEEISSAKAKNFESNKFYGKHEIVLFNGKLYRSITNFVAGTIFDPANWELISGGSGGGASQFIQNNPYIKGDLVLYDGKVYYAKENFNSGDTFNENNWNIIGPNSVGNFETSRKYLKGEFITLNNRLFAANQNIEAGEEFDPTKWEEIDESSVREFKPNNYYPKGSLILRENNLYFAKNSGTKVTFEESEWSKLISSNDNSKFVPLVPRLTDKKIPRNADLNTLTYAKFGVYYISVSADAATLINSPTRNAFTMRVYNPIDHRDSGEGTSTWLRVVREIFDIHGNIWIQHAGSQADPAIFNYSPWRKITHEFDLSKDKDISYEITHQNYGTAAPAPKPGKTIICLFTE